MTTVYINLEEIITPSKVYQLKDVEIDISKVSAYDSFRLMKYYVENKSMTANPDETMEIILDIINAQRDSPLSERDLLKRGTGAQIVGLLLALGSESLKTYQLSPKGDDSPLRAILKVIRPNALKSMSTESSVQSHSQQDGVENTPSTP